MASLGTLKWRRVDDQLKWLNARIDDAIEDVIAAGGDEDELRRYDAYRMIVRRIGELRFPAIRLSKKYKAAADTGDRLLRTIEVWFHDFPGYAERLGTSESANDGDESVNDGKK